MKIHAGITHTQNNIYVCYKQGTFSMYIVIYVVFILYDTNLFILSLNPSLSLVGKSANLSIKNICISTEPNIFHMPMQLAHALSLRVSAQTTLMHKCIAF